RLTRLLDAISATGIVGTLDVSEAYVPGAADLRGVGRALTLRHSTLPPGRLGVLAHGQDFTFVGRQGNTIRVRQGPDGLVAVAAPVAADEGSSIGLHVAPRAAASAVAVGATAVYVANSGSDTVSDLDPVTGRARRAIKVGWKPVAVVVSPDGQRLYT